MDYKKTNAPLNTVTRDMIELSEDTGNVYETVCIIAKRANQIAGEMKHASRRNFKSLPHSTTTSKKYPKTANRSKYPATTKSFPNPPLLPLRNTWTTSFFSATP